MILFQGSQDFNRSIQARATQVRVFCIGNFDGVHRGHQELLRRAREIAKEKGGSWGLLSFEPHPLKVLQPARYLPPLFSREDQAHQLRKWGADFLVLEPFNLEFSSLSSKDFVAEILCQQLKVNHIVVGFNFRFGKNKEGSVEFLKEQGKALGFGVDVVSPVQVEYESEVRTISTSLIRELLQRAEVDKIKSVLGRSFALTGTVVKGQQRGRLLGFPTANIHSEYSESLPLGVYRSRVILGERVFPAVTNVGKNPTFNSADSLVCVESHLLNFVGDLYGKAIEVEFLNYIRAEQKFSSKEDLVRQIKNDILAVATLAANE